MLKSFELESAMEYHYLNQGQDPIIPGVDDEKDFLEFIQAFQLLNLPQDRLIEIFRLLIGILVIGNIQFQASNDIASILVSCVSFFELQREPKNRNFAFFCEKFQKSGVFSCDF